MVLAQKEVETQVKEDVSWVLLEENLKKTQRTLENIGLIEYDTFRSFFSVQNDDDFVQKVEFLQKEYKLNQKINQWIIEASLLRKIYIDFYSKKMDEMPDEIKKRWNIYQEMQWYAKKSGALYSRLDIFHQNDYLGKWVWINKEGTFVNQNLVWKIPETIDEKESKIIVEKLDDKKILRFYVEWELFLATYVSPGSLGHKTPKLKIKWKNKPDLYHTSSEYPEASKKKNGQKWWAVMPYAVHVDGWVRVHASDGKIDGNPQSHGCVRTPLFYVKEIYEKVKELWIDTVTIDTTGIY